MSNYPNQNYIPPNQYQQVSTTTQSSYVVSQPVVQPVYTPVAQPIIVQNQQVMPSTNLDGVLRSNPAFIVCPYCRQGGVTRAESSCSFLNCCCCFCTGLVPWLVFQICRGKDINCCDATHFCTQCGNKLYTYQAC